MEETVNIVFNTAQDVKHEVVDQFSDVCEKKECFFCNKCNLNLTTFEALEYHFRCFHVAERRIKCFFCASCRKEYTSLDCLMKHLRREHTLETIDACDNCGVKLPFCYTLPTHYRLLKSKKTNCDACRKEHLETKNKKVKDKIEDLENFPEAQKKITIEKDSGERPENRIVLAELNTYCNDFFQESSTSLTAVPHHRALEPSSQTTVSEKDLQSVCRIIHSKKEPFLCKICELSFSLFDAIEDHLRGIHIAESIRKKFFCRICWKEFHVIEGLMSHLHRDHTSDTNPVCGNCGTKFFSPRSDSTQQFIKPMELYCNSCLKQQPELANENMTGQGKKTDYVNVVSRGRKSVQQKISAGKEASKGLEDANDVLIEQNIDSSEKKFASETLLTAHTVGCKRSPSNIYSKEEPERVLMCKDRPKKVDGQICACEKCGKIVLNEEKLAQHFCTKTMKHRCEICEKAFSSKSKLRIHSRLHTGEKPFSCNTCGQKYRFKKSLNNHHCRNRNKKKCGAIFSNEHEGSASDDYPKQVKQESCACEKCGKQYLNKEKLAQHSCPKILKHRCEVCEKVFSSKSKLRNHSRLHAGEKPFSCDICGQKYRFKKSLSNHHCRKSNENGACVDLSKEHTTSDMCYDRTEHSNGVPCTCEICGKQFLNKGKLAKHSRTHILKHRCHVCEKVFSSKRKLRAHCRDLGETRFSCDARGLEYCSTKSLENHQCKDTNQKNIGGNVWKENTDSELCGGGSKLTEEESYACEKYDEKDTEQNGQAYNFPCHVEKHSCEMCERVFCNVYSLRNHRLVHTGEKPYSCDICGQKYRLKASLRKHNLSHSNEKNVCDICPKQFPDGVLCEHLPKKIDEDQLVCEKCGKKFSSKKRLARHSVTHDLSCEICAKVFSSASSLRDHCHVHAGEEPFTPFSCDVCGKKFSYEKSFKKHCFIHTFQNKNAPSDSPARLTSHRCEICDVFFRGMSVFRRHLLMHTGEKPHACDLCGRKFGYKHSLTKHYRKHDNLKYFCDICGMGFQSAYYLREIHSLTHSGEKPHSCVACDKTFSTKQQLKIHFRTHSGEKPHVCETCGKKFAGSQDLKKHERLHTGERPYVCDFCGRGFTQKWVMVAHRRIHTGERPFECEVCQRGFIYKSQMKTHQLTHTKDNPGSKLLK